MLSSDATSYVAGAFGTGAMKELGCGHQDYILHNKASMIVIEGGDATKRYAAGRMGWSRCGRVRDSSFVANPHPGGLLTSNKMAGEWEASSLFPGWFDPPTFTT